MTDQISVTANGYELPQFAFVPPPDLSASRRQRYPVVIVGGGLVGLTAACDLSARGIACVMLDDDNTVGARGASSRGIAYARKSLEIFKRLGVYDRILAKGITWTTARTLWGTHELYSVDLSANGPLPQPPFINIQQFYVEFYLLERIRELGLADIRWSSEVKRVEQSDDHVVLHVSTPDGGYALEADWVIDASGVNSAVREQLGIDVETLHAHDRWCICDARFVDEKPQERWTWVEAPFNDGRAVWQHPMADGVWRLDYQMPPESDVAMLSDPDVARERVRAHLGDDVAFDLIWVGPWTYRNQIAKRFRAGRVFLVGDSAHAFSPFGGRGGNSGIQDAENLVWKLTMVLEGRADADILDSYEAERRPAAQYNIAVTSATASFLRPATRIGRWKRSLVLRLARISAKARQKVNTGKLSDPFRYAGSPLSWGEGASVPNARLSRADGSTVELVECVPAEANYAALAFDLTSADLARVREALSAAGVTVLDIRSSAQGEDRVGLIDAEGVLQKTLDVVAPQILLVRPDMHVAARSAPADVGSLVAVLPRAATSREGMAAAKG